MADIVNILLRKFMCGFVIVYAWQQASQVQWRLLFGRRVEKVFVSLNLDHSVSHGDGNGGEYA